MKIGVDGSRAFVKDKTGTENYSYQLLKALAFLDTENSYLVYIRPGCIVDPKEWPANFTFKLINFPRFWTQAGLAFETFLDRLDVLFVPSHTLPLIRRPGLRTVMTVHDLGAEYLPGLHQLKQRLYLGFITKFQLKSATKLIAVSNATKDDLLKKIHIDQKRVSVIYEGVNTLPLKKGILRKYGLENTPYLLFVGTVQPRKNLERLIEAFRNSSRKDNNKLVLVIVGGRGWLADDIYSAPKRLKIEDKVKFLGRIPDVELGAFYSGALAFVFPSLFEGFGLPIIEAFSLGCPVLTSNLSSIKEIAGDAAILVDPYDIDNISRGIKKLMNQDTRNKLIKKGKERAKKFSWEKTARETLDLLEGMV